MKTALIAGIGNVFHGDDGFGVAVAQRLVERARSTEVDAHVDVVDFGVRGLDLAYALTGGYRFAVLVDTIQRGGPVGTLYAIEPEVAPCDVDDPHAAGLSPHEMSPANVLRLAGVVGGGCAMVRLIACEPESFGDPEEGRLGLSDAVAAVVDDAAAMALAMVDDWLHERGLAGGPALHEEVMP